MTDAASTPVVVRVHARDPEVHALLDALTSELALGGYAASQTFCYSVAQLEQSHVYLVGARVEGPLIGLGGIELQGSGVGELKRFFLVPEHRGEGIADFLLRALIEYARGQGRNALRLETGDKQQAAIAFYRRHGFVEVPRFDPYRYSVTSVCMARSIAGQPTPPPKPGDGDEASRWPTGTTDASRAGR